MRLAANNFNLRVGDKSFDLKPSLRAAFYIHKEYGFANLLREIDEGNFTAICDVITQTCVNRPRWERYAFGSAAIADILGAREQLLEFVLLLSGADDMGRDEPPTGEPMPFEEYFTKLFQIGTGWLGWTPEATWSASPAEIVNAKEGRIEMLSALFGKRDDTETIDATQGMPADLRAEINAIGRGKR